LDHFDHFDRWRQWTLPDPEVPQHLLYRQALEALLPHLYL
jgi:hypothetical protein